MIFAHIGWGEALFLKDLFPKARMLLYCEFFYRARGSDMGFDPEFPPSAEKVLRLRVMNAPLPHVARRFRLGLGADALAAEAVSRPRTPRA